jgi:2'-5' RNA ligase
MKNELMLLPGYCRYEYLLVVQPHDELAKKISELKKDFLVRYEGTGTAWGKPFIPLLKFSRLQLVEERIINRLETIALTLPSFKVDLKDFGHLPTHTIYLKVETTNGLQMVVKHLKKIQSLLKSEEYKPHFMDKFYISVATKLLPQQYKKAWPEYSQKEFTGAFMVDKMLLMRRAEGTQPYEVINKFEFRNKPVLTSQGKLF